MAQITDYASLKAAAETYLAYDDIDDVFDTFVGLAEAQMGREVRIVDMMLTLTGQNFSASSTLTLPSDFLELVDFYEEGTGGGPLSYMPPQKFYSLTSARGGSGQPAYYTITGQQVTADDATTYSTVLTAAPLTDSTDRDYTLTYYAEPTGLTPSNTTNSLIPVAPDVYLYGVLLQAQPYLADQARLAEFQGLYDRARGALHAADSRARHRPGGRMRPNGVTTDGAFRLF